MKAPVLGSVLLLLVASAVAQDSNSWPKNPPNRFLNPDKQTFQKWMEQLPQAKLNWLSEDSLSLIGDGRNSTCMTMRTYRMKREGAGSDVTRPSGSMTCVPMARFTVEDATTPVESDSAE